MTTPVANNSTNPFASIGLSTPSGTSTTENASGVDATTALSGQNFMQLLLTQVQNQDPLNPMDSTAFLGQLAQLSTVSGIQDLNTNFSTLSTALSSNQAVQAASLVGHSALVNASTLNWDGTNASTAALTLPTASGDVEVNITDASGATVRTMKLGSQPAGNLDFSWDGTDANGATLPAGSYGISATATDNGQTTGLQTMATAVIQGVGLGGSNGLTLDLTGIGSVPLSQVQRIS